MFFFTFVTSYSIYIVVVVNIYVRDKVRKKKKLQGQRRFCVKPTNVNRPVNGA